MPLRQTGKSQKILKILMYCLHWQEDLAAREPESTDFLHYLYFSFMLIGDIKRDIGQAKRAFEYYQKYQHIVTKLVAVEPKRTDFLNDLQVSYMKMGDICHSLKGTKKIKLALQYYRRGHLLSKGIVAKYPDRTIYKYNLSRALRNVASIYQAFGKFKKALVYYKKSLTIAKEEYTLEPTSHRQANISQSPMRC